MSGSEQSSPEVSAAAGRRPRAALAQGCAVGILLLLAAMQALPRDLSPGLQLALAASLTQVLLLLAAVGWAALGSEPVPRRLGLAPGRVGVGGTLVLALGLVGVSHAADRLLQTLGLRELSHLVQVDAAISGEPALSWIPMLLGLALLPGFGEEIFFRGLLQRGFARRVGQPLAIALAALLFALFHGDLVHGAGALFLGLYLGAVAAVSGGTRSPIACHVLNNVAAVAGIAFPMPGLQSTPPLLSTLLGVILAAAALAGVSLRLRRSPDPRPPATPRA